MKHCFFITLVFALIFSFSGCSGDETEQIETKPAKPAEPIEPEPIEPEPDPIETELWGEWYRIDANETWYISGKSILINDVKTSRNVALSRQSQNIIQVTEGSRIYYLIASRIANAHFSGRVAGFNGSLQQRNIQRSVAGGKGWINVVVDHLKTDSSTTTTTNENGNFIVSDSIPGDDYRITPEGGSPIYVKPDFDGDNIGTITVVAGNDENFKINIVGKGIDIASGYFVPDEDKNIGANRRLYAKYLTYFSYPILSDSSQLREFNPTYSFTISIQNTGQRDATAAIYQLTLDSGLNLASGNTSGVLGTIEPGKSKNFDISLRYNESMPGDYVFRNISIAIIDTISGRVWNDSISLRFFKENVPMILTSNLRGMLPNGVIISPTGDTARLRSAQPTWFSEYFSVPKLTNGDYLFVFCGATADTETVYSLKIGNLSYQDNALGTDISRYEPNDTENTATVITGGIRAYLHKNDIDFYRFRY